MSGFFDNPDEIVHRTCMYDEAPEFENEDKIKKEAMPISLWMSKSNPSMSKVVLFQEDVSN